jgi:DeoR family fructose operon transcriptional repressor
MNVDSIDRVEQIRARVDAEGRVRVGDLAADLDVSEMTIRRDLDLLAERGLVRRVRGGAMALGPQLFADRFRQQTRAKDRIAAKLAVLVGETGAIGIDASTTLQRLARSLDGGRDLTVVTNGPEVFAALQERPGVTALLTGGQLDGRTGSLVGPMAARAARDVALRTLFVSAAGIDPSGTTEVTLEEADVKLALAESSTEIVVAVDHTKLGRRGSARCLPVERIDALVTDLDPKDRRLDPYRGLTKVV